MAVTMAQGYFLIKNKAKFDEWAKITRTDGKQKRLTVFMDLCEIINKGNIQVESLCNILT
jgi:hypothetical protein